MTILQHFWGGGLYLVRTLRLCNAQSCDIQACLKSLRNHTNDGILCKSMQQVRVLGVRLLWSLMWSPL